MKNKFEENDVAYTPLASFNNGTKHYYEKVIICRFLGNKQYSFKHSDGSVCVSCPQQFLLNENELKERIKSGSKLLKL